MAWKIEHHTLLDEEPEISGGVCTNLSEDLLQITKGAYVIDVGFYGDRYRVMLIRDGNWDQPLRQRDCKHRQDAVRIVEEWLRDEMLVA